jgi:hypothetical protein
MRLRYFLLGLLLGLALAPASSRAIWRMFRDGLATAIDAALRIGTDSASPTPQRNNSSVL